MFTCQKSLLLELGAWMGTWEDNNADGDNDDQTLDVYMSDKSAAEVLSLDGQ